MNANLVRTSKFLSLVLRHKPQTIGLSLDENGWAEVDDLLEKARQHGRTIDRPLLEHVVETNDKKRFVISDDGERIRANQGHSVQVDLQLQASEAPDTLYHGTVQQFLDSIRRQGLVRGQRHHVHLSVDEGTARKVGGRRGQPVILVVDSAAMQREGHTFFLSENGVWLTDHVPADFISFPE